MRVAREKCKINFFKDSFGIVYKKLLLLIKINKSWGILVRNFRKRHENILEIILFLRNFGKMKFPALTTKNMQCIYVSLKQSIRKKEESEHVNIVEIAEKLEKLCMKGKLKH